MSLLKKKRVQEQLLNQTDGQLQNLEQMVNCILSRNFLLSLSTWSNEIVFFDQLKWHLRKIQKPILSWLMDVSGVGACTVDEFNIYFYRFKT